jgi:Tfp pilus assembly protein PilN
MKTHFNLATAPLENHRRFIAGSSVLAIIALAAMVLLAMHAVRVRQANSEMRTAIDNLREQVRIAQRQQEALRSAFESPQAVESLKRSEFLNGLIEARTFPWTKMFADLEQILPAGVRVKSISPQMDSHGNVKVVLSIGAVNDEQEMKFLNSIDASPVFSEVRVMQESHPQRERAGDEDDKVLVNLEARYSIS